MKKILFLLALLASNAYASGEYYLHGSYPAQGAAASSSAMRAELDLIQAGFDKLPTLSGNANKVCLVNSGATGLTALSSLGTTTTVLHGNASGAPTWGAISLPTDVSGILPTANGGTGIAYFTAAGPTVARTYTFPDATTTVLTTNAAVTVPQGGTGTGTLTNHGVVLGQGSGTVAVTSAGTSGQVLTSNGASADPTFQSPATGAMVLLATLTPTAAANVDALSTFTSSYDSYLIIGTGILPAADDVLRFRLANAGTADSGSNYFEGGTYAGGTITAGTTTLSVTGTTTSAGTGANFSMLVSNANSATSNKGVSIDSTYQTNATPGYASRLTRNTYPAANAVSGIRLYWSGGSNFAAAGKIRIYGIAN